MLLLKRFLCDHCNVYVKRSVFFGFVFTYSVLLLSPCSLIWLILFVAIQFSIHLLFMSVWLTPSNERTNHHSAYCTMCCIPHLPRL